MHVSLSRAEKDLLANLLGTELEEIRSEFHHAKNHEYKESIKERESLVRGMLTKLAAGGA